MVTVASSKSSWALIVMATASEWNNITHDIASGQFSTEGLCVNLYLQYFRCWGCRQRAETMTKYVPGISLQLQQSHKLFSTTAQCLSTIHFSILPLRLWHLLQDFVRGCTSVSLYIIPLNFVLFHTKWTDRQSYAQGFRSVLVSVFIPAHHDSSRPLWKWINQKRVWLQSKPSGSIWCSLQRCPWMEAACRSHTDRVILTCTRPPLHSHWSRSPGSCPCSLPAPGHRRRSPCKPFRTWRSGESPDTETDRNTAKQTQVTMWTDFINLWNYDF